MDKSSSDLLSPAALIEQLVALGVQVGSTLLVHASFRAIRPVAGGPLGVIDALRDVLGPEGTVVMPSMTGSRRPAPYDPSTTPTRHMGAVAEVFWRQPGVQRSDHPTSAFAAIGKHASFITAPQPLTPVHGPDSPVGRVHELNGSVLLLGVGHNVNTSVHLAEVLASVPYGIEKWCTALIDGVPRRVTYREQDHCTRGFARIEPLLTARGLQREGFVGHARARMSRARDVVDAALQILATEPTGFLCPASASCAECDAAWSSIPGVG